MSNLHGTNDLPGTVRYLRILVSASRMLMDDALKAMQPDSPGYDALSAACPFMNVAEEAAEAIVPLIKHASQAPKRKSAEQLWNEIKKLMDEEDVRQ